MNRLTWTATAVAGALVVGAAVWWVTPFGEVAEVGQEIGLATDVGPDEFDLGLDRQIEFLVPGGSVVVRVGETADDLPHGSRTADIGELDDGDLHAARGAGFLPLQWDVVPLSSTTVVKTVGYQELPAMLDLGVRAGGTHVEVPHETFSTVAEGRDLHRRGVILVLPKDDLKDVQVELTFDGVTQTADVATGTVEAGVAEALYGSDDVPETGLFPVQTLPMTGRLASRFDLDAVVTIEAGVPQPWLPDLGWVEEPGQAWWSARIGTTLPPFVSPDRGREGVDDRPGDDSGHDVLLRGSSETLDGRAPLEPLAVNHDAPGNIFALGVVTWLVDGSPAELTVRQELELRPRDGGGATRVVLQSTGDVSG